MQTDILIVASDTREAELMVLALERLSTEFVVELVRTGDEAFQFLYAKDFYQHKFSFQMPTLIFVDAILPDMGCLSFLKQLRTKTVTLGVPVVVMVAPGNEAVVARAYQCGANGCVLKSPDKVAFVENVCITADYWLRVAHQFRSQLFADSANASEGRINNHFEDNAGSIPPLSSTSAIE